MKKLENLKKVFDLRSFEDASKTARSFNDAGGVILARNLEHVSAEIFTQEYPDLTFMQQGITVNNEGGWASTITKLKMATEGGFRTSGSNTQTTGKITMGGESDSLRVISKEAESDWSLTQLKEAELQNINLPSRFIAGHSEIYNRELDELGFLGTEGDNGLLTTGWDSVSASGTAATLSGLELYDTIAALINKQWSSVRNTAAFKANKVVLGDTVYNLLLSKMMTSDLAFTSDTPQADPLDPITTALTAQILASTDSVMAALVKNFPGITFSSTDKADDLGSGTGVAVAFSDNRSAMQFRLPVPLTISSVHQLGHKYYMESMYRAAGLDVIESKAAAILTGL